MSGHSATPKSSSLTTTDEKENSRKGQSCSSSMNPLSTSQKSPSFPLTTNYGAENASLITSTSFKPPPSEIEGAETSEPLSLQSSIGTQLQFDHYPISLPLPHPQQQQNQQNQQIQEQNQRQLHTQNANSPSTTESFSYFLHPSDFKLLVDSVYEGKEPTFESFKTLKRETLEGKISDRFVKERVYNVLQRLKLDPSQDFATKTQKAPTTPHARFVIGTNKRANYSASAASSVSASAAASSILASSAPSSSASSSSASSSSASSSSSSQEKKSLPPPPLPPPQIIPFSRREINLNPKSIALTYLCPVSGTPIDNKQEHVRVSFTGGQQMHFCSTNCCRQFSEQPSRFLLGFTSKSDSFHEVLRCPVLNKPVLQGVRAVFKGGQTMDFCCTDCVQIFIVDLDRLTAHRDNLFGLKERLEASSSSSSSSSSSGGGAGCCAGPPPPGSREGGGGILAGMGRAVGGGGGGGGGGAETPRWMIGVDQPNHHNQPLGNANDIIPSSSIINHTPQRHHHHHHHLALLQQQQHNLLGGNISDILPPLHSLGSGDGSRSLAHAAAAALVTTGSLCSSSPLGGFHHHRLHHQANNRSRPSSSSSISSSPAALAGTGTVGGSDLVTSSYTSSSSSSSSSSRSSRSPSSSMKRSLSLTVPRPPEKKRKFTCELCNRSFANKSNLNRHQLVHTGERPFKCTHCGKTFTQRGNMNQHIRVHTGERPYKCGTCSKSFRQYAAFAKHLSAFKHLKPTKAD